MKKRRAAKFPVALTSCTLEGKTGTLVFDYASASDFVKFAQETGELYLPYQRVRADGIRVLS